MQRAVKLLERDFERQVKDYLEWDGWRTFHFEQVWAEERKRTFGEAGMPDLLAIRYNGPSETGSASYLALAEVYWIEFKRPGKKAAPHQKLWKVHEQKLGALVVTAGEEFEADYDSFVAWYEASGLKRRI